MAATLSSSQGPLPFDVRLTRAGANVLLVLAVLGMLAASLIWLARQPWFAFRSLQVDGEVIHNTPASVRNLVMPQLKGGYFTMDLREARQAFEAVPWVRRAQVRRVWPDRLVVTLEEHKPVAYWVRGEGDDLLVNDHGEVFEVNLGDVDDDNLPTLQGPQGSAPQVLAMWRQLAPTFAPMRARLDELALTDRGSWRAKLDSGAVMELGRGEPGELQTRTERFVRSVPQIMVKFDRRAIEYVDLRHSDSYALRLAGITTALQTAKPKPN
jgi:cell division protein FtsQ